MIGVCLVTKGVLLLDGTVRLSRPRSVSGVKSVNHVAPTRLANGKASLDPLRSVQFYSLVQLTFMHLGLTFLISVIAKYDARVYCTCIWFGLYWVSSSFFDHYVISLVKL